MQFKHLDLIRFAPDDGTTGTTGGQQSKTETPSVDKKEEIVVKKEEPKQPEPVKTYTQEEFETYKKTLELKHQKDLEVVSKTVYEQVVTKLQKENEEKMKQVLINDIKTVATEEQLKAIDANWEKKSFETIQMMHSTLKAAGKNNLLQVTPATNGNSRPHINSAGGFSDILKESMASEFNKKE